MKWFMVGIVVKGYITRFFHENEWQEELVEHKGDLVDGDAIAYYVQGDDGRYYEWYHQERPEGEKVYVVAPSGVCCPDGV